jgi:hypothetical protein
VYVPLRYHHHKVRDDHSWAQPSRFLSRGVRATLEEVPCPPSVPTRQTSGPLPTIDSAGVVAGHLSSLW